MLFFFVCSSSELAASENCRLYTPDDILRTVEACVGRRRRRRRRFFFFFSESATWFEIVVRMGGPFDNTPKCLAGCATVSLMAATPTHRGSRLVVSLFLAD